MEDVNILYAKNSESVALHPISVGFFVCFFLSLCDPNFGGHFG